MPRPVVKFPAFHLESQAISPANRRVIGSVSGFCRAVIDVLVSEKSDLPDGIYVLCPFPVLQKIDLYEQILSKFISRSVRGRKLLG
jgi:hypothetical protein